MAHTNDRAGVANPLTLADVGGSYLKAAVLKASAKMSTDPVRVKTPKPAMPDAVVAGVVTLVSFTCHRASSPPPVIYEINGLRRCS
jgi:hypothetical protein